MTSERLSNIIINFDLLIIIDTVNIIIKEIRRIIKCRWKTLFSLHGKASLKIQTRRKLRNEERRRKKEEEQNRQSNDKAIAKRSLSHDPRTSIQPHPNPKTNGNTLLRSLTTVDKNDENTNRLRDRFKKVNLHFQIIQKINLFY